MDAQQTAGCVFMCRLCNLFSPNRSQLLCHCFKLHPEHASADDIVVTLRPLVEEPKEQLPEGSEKRKRGRPKGSTKKIHKALTNSPTNNHHSHVDQAIKKVPSKQEGKQLSNSTEDESQGGILGLECRSCHRSFSNRRQILKHICLNEEVDVDDEQKSGISGDSGNEASQTEKLKKTCQSKTKSGLTRRKDVSAVQTVKNNQSVSAIESIHLSGSEINRVRNHVVSVVLTEDETLPDVSKMVPMESSSQETDSNTVQAQHQDPAKDINACKKSASEETSDNLTNTSTNKGFQEYAIKQNASNLLQSELKIFACEFCNKIFKFRHSLVAHLRTHTKEKPFKCSHCDYASSIKANLNVHLRKHTGERFTCHHCSFSCLSQGHLKVHIERVHLKVKQNCSFCDKKYSDVKNLLKHIEKLHNLKDSAVYQNYQNLRLKTRQGLRQLLYRCPTCNRCFKNMQERERHLLIHGPQRPFACPLCNHAVTKFDALASHVRKHVFIYVCCECDEKLVSSQRLRDHLAQSHPELDQDQGFDNSINISYYLIPPKGSNEDEGTTNLTHTVQEGSELPGQGKRCQDEQTTTTEQKEQEANSVRKEVIGVREESGQATVLHSDKGQEVSQAKCATTTSNIAAPTTKDNPSSLKNDLSTLSNPEETQSKFQACATNTSADKSTCLTDTCSSLGDSKPSSVMDDLCSDSHFRIEGGQTSANTKVVEDSSQSAFQQVLSSLPKTRLDVETFKKLRKMYGDLECQYCGKLFWYKVNYKVHLRTHTKEHLHYCSECNYSSITKGSLKRHQIQKHCGMKLSCSSPGCKYTTPDKYKLRFHVRTVHEQGKSVACTFCGNSFPEHRLKHHMKSSHPDKLPARGKGSMVHRAEKCPYCDSYFLKNSSDFQQHIWAHQGLKPFACSMCDYTSRSRSNLRAHMNRHNAEKHHLCDLCGKKFKTKVTLRSHRLSHTEDEKQFQCSKCDFTTILKASLLRHMEQHAKFKPFHCAHCQYSCNSTGSLKRHYNMKHPQQSYENAGPGLLSCDTLKEQGGLKCPECEFVYGTKWELNRHLRSKHNLKVVEGTLEVAEEIETQYVTVGEGEELTDTPMTIMEENVDLQQVAEFSSETEKAVTSMVAMGPGTVTVVQQLQVASEQEITECANQLMVVNTEGVPDGDQVMVVEDAHGLEALTVLTEDENTHHYIVYVQEQTVEI